MKTATNKVSAVPSISLSPNYDKVMKAVGDGCFMACVTKDLDADIAWYDKNGNLMSTNDEESYRIDEPIDNNDKEVKKLLLIIKNITKEGNYTCIVSKNGVESSKFFILSVFCKNQESYL